MYDSAICLHVTVPCKRLGKRSWLTALCEFAAFKTPRSNLQSHLHSRHIYISISYLVNNLLLRFMLNYLSWYYQLDAYVLVSPPTWLLHLHTDWSHRLPLSMKSSTINKRPPTKASPITPDERVDANQLEQLLLRVPINQTLDLLKSRKILSKWWVLGSLIN